jgi:putative acetyltransferase
MTRDTHKNFLQPKLYKWQQLTLQPMLRLEHIRDDHSLIPLIKTLFSEYASELGEDLCFQSFDEELANPFKKYGSPYGALIIAYWNDEPEGCIALQKVSGDSVCEMKRLYVRPAYRKYRIGQALVTALLEEATNLGYRSMVLDTLERLQPAIKLYQKYGFTETTAYYDNPLPGVVYMEKVISPIT